MVDCCASDSKLLGRTILLVEDEALVALMIEVLLQDMGCVIVETVSRVQTALAAVVVNVFDAAILDVNLKGEMSFVVADALDFQRIPYLFCTGNAEILPPLYIDKIVLRKPFRKRELQNALTRLFINR